MEFNKEKCCGCAACLHVCPVKAIKWVQNEEGFGEPEIDSQKCIDCGLCRKVCPYEQSTVGKDADPEIYAAVHKDPKVVEKSSSGGVFTALSDWILSKSGVVYGVTYGTDYDIAYCRCEDKQHRDEMRGSKYVQCCAKDVYSQVEQDLNGGRFVMFTGTPCQNYGLRSYLEVKKINTEHLYTCENICHGGSSPLVWKTYLEYIRGKVLKGKQILSFSMRSKKTAWQKQFVECNTECGDESKVLNDTASWNKLFLTTYPTRRSCFQCPFTSYLRLSDITTADYWNIENAKLDIDYSEGVSLVLVNTPKGREWFAQCMPDLTVQPSTKKACWQIHLEKPVVYTAKRKQFWDEFAENPEQTVRKYAKGSLFNKVTRVISPILRKIGLYTLAVHILSRIKEHAKKNS
jgi:coenzyme F420-reducing hydrogenase beta subunit